MRLLYAAILGLSALSKAYAGIGVDSPLGTVAKPAADPYLDGEHGGEYPPGECYPNVFPNLIIGEGGLDFTGEGNELCVNGKIQTPIDVKDILGKPTPVPKADSWGMPDFKAWDTPVVAGVQNTDHGPRMTFGNLVTRHAGKTLTLAQWHTHAPSEHTFDGKHYDAEIHFVHTEGKDLWVFGVMVDIGKKANPVWQALIDAAKDVPQEDSSVVELPKKITLSQLLPRAKGGKRPYVRYTGSLTTPPCSEGVNWTVFKDPISISAEQWYEYLRLVARTPEVPHGAHFFPNNRQVQKLNGRDLAFEGF